MSETIEMPAIDKSTWGPGPWQDEPERVDFTHAGMSCLALRHSENGHWCGYVGVPREHPLYGKVWTETPEISDLDAHMGVNYSAACDGAICHVPAPGMPDDVWWLGCDFGHSFDLSPAIAARERAWDLHQLRKSRELPEFMREVYRPLPYVRHVIERLAEQLATARPERGV